MMQLKYSKAALKDLKNIYKRSASQFGMAQAERYRSGLLDVFSSVAEFPLMALVHEGYSRPLRIRPYGSHIIFFVIENDVIIVSRVLHQSQDWQNLL